MMAVLKGGYTYGEDGHVKTGEGTSLVVQGLRLHSQYACLICSFLRGFHSILSQQNVPLLIIFFR